MNIKRKIVLIILVCFISSCKTMTPNSNELVKNEIVQYITNSCKDLNPCEIHIKDMTNFNWDKLLVFDMSFENSSISDVIGNKFSSEDYSRKWFFLEKGQIRHFEQAVIPKVDNPINSGDVEIDISSFQEHYGFFDKNTMFRVEKIKIANGEFYRLHSVKK